MRPIEYSADEELSEGRAAEGAAAPASRITSRIIFNKNRLYIDSH